jgi:hypothetical protein
MVHWSVECLSFDVMVLMPAAQSALGSFYTQVVVSISLWLNKAMAAGTLLLSLSLQVA